MTTLIEQVVNVWRGADGSTAELVEDGSRIDFATRFDAVRRLPRPAREVAAHLLLSDGTQVAMPTPLNAYMLPDRTGVVAIFKPGQYTKPDGTDHFPEPNNAAIFNADGSLRFQLITPKNSAHRIAAFHGGSMPDKWALNMGLLIATHADAPPEWVYAVDPRESELISTGQWVRY